MRQTTISVYKDLNELNTKEGVTLFNSIKAVLTRNEIKGPFKVPVQKHFLASVIN